MPIIPPDPLALLEALRSSRAELLALARSAPDPEPYRRAAEHVERAVAELEAATQPAS